MHSIKFVIVNLVMVAWAASGFGAEPNTTIAPHAKDLVVLQGEKLVPLDARKFLLALVTILYFGAGWCPDCRKFSPKLVSAYNAQVGEKKFEVLFISKDKAEDGMIKFMQLEKMPWPALSFDQIRAADDLAKFYSGKGIPCLTAINRKGEILKQSNSDQDAAEILRSIVTK
jgi:nucleoredoxin